MQLGNAVIVGLERTSVVRRMLDMPAAVVERQRGVSGVDRDSIETMPKRV